MCSLWLKSVYRSPIKPIYDEYKPQSSQRTQSPHQRFFRIIRNLINLCGVLCELRDLCGYNPLSVIQSNRFAIRYIPKATTTHDHCNHPRDQAGDHQNVSGDSGVPAPRPGLQRGPHWCRMRFKVIISNVEDGWLVVECPSLPGCISQGRTVEEALENINDAIQGCLNVLGDRTTADPIELLRWRPW